MRQRSLAVLEKLLANIRALEARGVARETRLTELLYGPEEASENWFMFVDSRHNAALAIVETKRMTEKGAASVWTQGSNFSVTKGDIFYDSSRAYRPWNPANAGRCFVVTFATRVAPGSKDQNTGRLSPRLPGRVDFDILELDVAKSALVKTGQRSMTQDEFVRTLICGFEGQLSLV